MADGKIIRLENGSLWQVDDIDTITTSLWLPTSEVVLCNGKIINVDDGEKASVRPIGPGAAQIGGSSPSQAGFLIQAAANDETFVINGEVFKAQTYCFGFERGDRVKFVSGSASGACATATLLNLRNGKICKVWCE